MRKSLPLVPIIQKKNTNFLLGPIFVLLSIHQNSLSIVYRVKNNNKTDKVLFRGGVFLAGDSDAVIVYVYKAKQSRSFLCV